MAGGGKFPVPVLIPVTLIALISGGVKNSAASAAFLLLKPPGHGYGNIYLIIY
jgi:hypothetical protein